MSLDDQPLTLADFKKLMAEHEQKECLLKKEMLDEFMSAFPDGDPLPHRQYHQSKIDAAKAEKDFWVAAKMKLVEHGISGLVKVIWIVMGLALFGLSVQLGLKLPGISAWFGGMK